MQQTLRQVCAELKFSRRTIQGYEKAGLVAPSGKTNTGICSTVSWSRNASSSSGFISSRDFR